MASQLKTELTLNDRNFTARLNTATAKAKASLNEIQQSTKGLSGLLGNLSGKIGGLTGNLNGLLSSASKLANPWVAAGTAIVGAGVAFFNYNKNLEETLNKTAQFTGLSGNALNSLRNGIQAVANTFGKDFNSVLSSVDGLMSQFGISGETALKIIQDGFVAGADDSGQFLDNLSKYSGAFNDIGVSADELTALLAQTRSGIFSQEGMDAIQMAGKNIRNMSNSAKQSLSAIGISGDEMIQKLSSGQMTTMDAIRQISGALKKLPPQSQEVGNVLQDVFGKKGSQAGYELITALEGVSTNLEEVKKQTGEAGKIQEELVDTTRDFQNACQSLFGVTDSGFSHLTDQLKINVMQALTKVINRFIDLYNNSLGVRRGVLLIKGAFQSMWNSVSRILKSFVETLAGLAGMIANLLEGDWSGVGNSFKRALNGLAGLNPVKMVGDLIDDVVDESKKAWTNATNSKIDKVTTVKPDESEYGKSSGKGGSGGSSTGKGGKSGKDKKSGSSKNTKVEPVTGSLGDLEKKLKDLQDKYKNGLIKITPENYQKQVNELEQKIVQKKLEIGTEISQSDLNTLEDQLKDLMKNNGSEDAIKNLQELIKKTKVKLGVDIEEDSIQDIEEKLNKLRENQNSKDFKLHIDQTDFYKQEAELTKKLQQKKLEVLFSVDKNSLSALEQQLKNIEENQVSENVYLHLDPTEYKKQHKELEQQIESQKIKLGVSLSLDDLNKEYNQTFKDFQKKSSFEIAVGKPKINKYDFEGQLTSIQEQMDANDQLLEQLKELQKAYKELGPAGEESYNLISSEIDEVNAKQAELSSQAVDANEKAKEQKKWGKSLSESSEALGNFGSAMSSLAALNDDDKDLQIGATIAQGIASIVQGAGEAIAKAGELGPWGWAAAGIGIMAQMAAMIAQIHSITGYAQGGRIGGGSYVGDKQIIRVNSGEYVMNNGQQARLWRILNGESSMSMQPAYANGQVEFVIKGQNLYGVLNNYNRKMSKI